MAQIPKPLKDISKADLQAVCDGAWPEDEQLDFKVAIPFKGQPEDDPWRTRRAIPDYGRDQLLATVIAFANSYGGDLLVGIEETAGNPGTARALAPLPNCADAADRLSKQANACVEPHLPTLEVQGIPTEADGSGVILLRVGPSRNAPHRLNATKDCYHRVRHETLAMSMRQIQDSTLNTSRGLAAIDEKFKALRDSFLLWSKVRAPLQGNKRSALRVSCVPLSECFLERVHDNPAVTPTNSVLNGIIGGRVQVQMHPPMGIDNWRPILRGSAGSGTRTVGASRVHLYCDGALSYETSFEIAESEDTAPNRRQRRVHNLYGEWLFGLVGNAMRTADKFRNSAGCPATEFGIEIEIAASHPLPVLQMGNGLFIDEIGQIEPNQQPYPRYAMGPRDSWPQVLTQMFRDFWNSAGVSATETFDIPG